MNERHLQDKFILPFFSDDLGYQEVKANTVTASLIIEEDLQAFIETTSLNKKPYQALLKKYHKSYNNFQIKGETPMKPEKLREIISAGESLTVEFKQSRNKLNRDVFETVCAFLNRNGGHLFLGVDDQGGIVGIEPAAIEKLKMDFVTA